MNERQLVIDTALTWLKTPYISGGRLKGCGCDCATFLAGVFEEAGLIKHIKIDYYPTDIACNNSTPFYLQHMMEFTERIDEEPLPADIIFYKFPGAKVPHHAALCMDKEYIIHCYIRQGVIISNRRGYQKYEYGTYRFKRWIGG